MDAFVIHYTPLKERKGHILRECQREGVNPIFITDYDRDVLTPEDIAKFRLHSNFTLSKVSLILKHIDAWRKIVENDLKYGLILEDDATLAPSFLQKLRVCLDELPLDFDILMFNDGCNFHIPESMLVEGKHVYYRGVHPTIWGGNGATRCTDGYIISNKCALMLTHMYDSLTTKIDLPIDWWMNELLRSIDGKAYWTEPSLGKQASFENSY